MSDVTNLEIRSLILTFEKFAKADWHKQTKFGIKPSEIRLLLWVKDISQQNEHGVTISEISKCLMVTSPTVTQMVKSLNHNGFIERCVDAHDRRVADIKLTAKGENVVQQASKRKVALYTGLIDSLGKEQTKQLISLLDQVYDYFDKASKE
ncbi:MAG: MarR family winged helix-turn-helix transcriptional regulator [Paenibacillaceae bacterium]